MTDQTCRPLQLWRIWPANGLSVVVKAHCIHEHYPPGDWALHRENGEIVAVMQASGTVIVNQSIQERDAC